MTFTSTVVLLAFAAIPAQAQQVRPEESLNQATQLLANLPAASGSDQLAVLRQHFTDFASTYLAGPATPSTATPGAVGTSGTNAADWRTKYQQVEADLAALLGPTGAPASAAAVDPATRTALERVRSQLQTFYAATLGQPNGNPVAHTGAPQASAAGASSGSAAPVAPTGEAPQTTRSGAPAASAAAPSSVSAATGGTRTSEVDTEWGTALAMLDRIDRVLNDAIKEPGKVTIDRAAIDEIRAEVAQVRTMLKATGKN